jgi:hypothetical protein
MSDEEKEVWDMGDAGDLDGLIDREALQKLVNSHIIAATKEFMSGLVLDLSGEDVKIVDIDVTDSVVATHSLDALLDEQIDMHIGGDTYGGPAKYLERAKKTLVVLESAVAKYRKAVSGWVVEEYEEE